MKNETVPEEVICKVNVALMKLAQEDNPTLRQFRDLLTERVAQQMGEFRFDKAYRHEATPMHALIYAIISTVGANATADNFQDMRERA